MFSEKCKASIEMPEACASLETGESSWPEAHTALRRSLVMKSQLWSSSLGVALYKFASILSLSSVDQAEREAATWDDSMV